MGATEKRVNNKSSRFLAIEHKGIDARIDTQSVFGRAFTCIVHLEGLYIRENDPLSLGRPKSHQEWMEIWVLVKSTEKQ